MKFKLCGRRNFGAWFHFLSRQRQATPDDDPASITSSLLRSPPRWREVVSTAQVPISTRPYKTSLRQGEKLTAEELGCPRPPETNGSLNLLLSSVNLMGRARLIWFAGLFHFMGASRAQGRRGRGAAAANFSQRDNTNVTWEASRAFHAFGCLAGHREATRISARAASSTTRRIFQPAQSLFVQLRTAAQFFRLTRSSRCTRGIGRAQADLTRSRNSRCSITRTSARQSDDSHSRAGTPVRLHGKHCSAGWSEESLAALQRRESVDLTDAHRKGNDGRTRLGEAAFSYLRSVGPAERMKMFNFERRRAARARRIILSNSF